VNFKCQGNMDLSDQNKKKSQLIQKSRLDITIRNVKEACACRKEIKKYLRKNLLNVY